MREIKGPAIFLAQFLSDQAPFNSLKSITRSFIRDHIIRVTEHAFDDSAGAAGVGGRGAARARNRRILGLPER